MKLKTLLLGMAMTGLAWSCTEDNPVLTVEGGKIQGLLTETEGVYVYKGIPYAAPPVGDLRWKVPQPVVPWDGVRQCSEFSCAACPWTARTLRKGILFQG